MMMMFAAKPGSHEILVRLAPARHARRRHAGNLVGQPVKLVGQHHPADQAGIAMVEIADRDLRARPQIVVHILIEQSDRAAVGMALQIASDPVKPVAEALGEQRAPGVEQQPRRFDCSAGDDHQVGRLSLAPVVGVKILDGFRAAFGVEDDPGDDAAAAQFAMAGGEGSRDHRVVRAALGVAFAGETARTSGSACSRAARCKERCFAASGCGKDASPAVARRVSATASPANRAGAAWADGVGAAP